MNYSMNIRRGFSLVEVIIAIWLLGVFTLIASRLFEADFHTARSTLQSSTSAARFDHAVIALRSDVEHAISVEMADTDTLRVHQSAAASIEWQVHGHSISRVASADRREWDIDRPLGLKMDGAVVLLVDGLDEIAMAPIHPAGGQ